jgi:plastocyanin
MKLVRVIGLMFTVAIAAALLAACGGDDEKTGDGAAATTGPAASPTGGGNGENTALLEIAAENTEYDVNELTAPAGADVTLTFDNDDPGIQHNWSLYETEESKDALFAGEILTGVDSQDYEFTAPEDPGTYHFHCDIHPSAMTGDFIVE